MIRPTKFEDLSDYDQQAGKPTIQWPDTEND